jgi:hypothetical protein
MLTSGRPLNLLPPLATALLLLALLATGGIDAHRHRGVEVYMAGVRDAIEAIPHRIGSAVGSDVEPTPAAVRILSPNKILQRRYIDPLSGAGMSLLIVHCGDVRDMLGHYPPVCYRAHGWQPGSRTTLPIEIDQTGTFAAVYEFSRRDDLAERRMTIVNFFILPGERAQFATDMDAVERLAGLRAAAGLGVAQIQIVMEGTPSTDERARTVAEVLPVLEPVVRAISRGAER